MSTNCPHVSIIIPCYNRQRFIGAAIESAFLQGPDVEVIVVDDGSTDESGEIIDRYSAVQSVRIPNSGPSAARNAGIGISRGQFIRFLDSDDRFVMGSTDLLVLAAEEVSSRHIVFGDAKLIDEMGIPLTGERYGYSDAPPGDLSFDTLLSRPMPLGLPLFPAQILRAGLTLNEELRLGEDYELVVRLALEGYTFVHAPLVTYQVREHDDARLTRAYGAEGYRALLNTFQTVYNLLQNSRTLGQQERNAVAKMVWGLGRAAARERLQTESGELFKFAYEIAGSSGVSSPLPLKLAYEIVSPFMAETILETLKSVIRGRARS